jgi:hypothetical protein
LPSTSRGDRKFCSPSCRTSGYRARQRRRSTLAEAVQRPTHEPVAGTSAPDQQLAAALEQALAEPRLVAWIAKASRSNWRAAAWLLERTYPERWAATTRQRRPDEDPHGQPDPFAEFVVDELAARRKRD